MGRRKITSLSIGLLALGCLAAAEGFTSLFDGASLAGWEGSTDVFHVAEGAIVAGTLDHGQPHNEFLCTKKEYGDFELRLKFKVRGKGANAGVQFRSARIPNHHEVRGYQADLGDGYWGCLYDESRRNKILVQADAAVIDGALRHDDWNDYQIRCEGPRIQIWLNGKQTVDYTEKEADIARSGIIGLQIHGGGPSDASYKDIEIKPL